MSELQSIIETIATLLPLMLEHPMTASLIGISAAVYLFLMGRTQKKVGKSTNEHLIEIEGKIDILLDRKDRNV